MRKDLRWRVTPTEANGQPAFAHYLLDADTGQYAAHSITVLGIRRGGIAEMDAFLIDEADSVLITTIGVASCWGSRRM